MSTNPTLPLSLVMPISVVVSPAAVPGLTFNQGLFVGSSNVIPTVPGGSGSLRIRQYFSLTAMVSDGFQTTSAEYLAASIYFGQQPQPESCWIGRQNLTSVAQVTAASGNLGSGYVVGDVLTITQSGASFGTVLVTNVNAGALAYESTTASGSAGAASITVASATGLQVGMTITGSGIAPQTTVSNLVSTTVTLSQPTTAILSTTPVIFSGISVQTGGTAYTAANNLPTTGGTGTGAEVDIIAVGETPLQAVIACRTIQPAWYACMFVATCTDADLVSIAGFIEAATPDSTFFLTSGEAAILNNTTGNLFATLQGLKYRRTLSVYSTTQSGQFPNNIYASAAPMGYAMGANTGAAGSYFILKFKALTGIGPEPLSQTQYDTIAGTDTRSAVGLNGNVFVNFNNGAYSWLANGTMANGGFFDTVLFLDMIANAMQTFGINLLTSVPALPITDAGVNQMKAVLAQALAQSQAIGFIAPTGIWDGNQVGTGSSAVSNGQILPAGYYLYAPSVNTLNQSQRGARQLPPITALLIQSEGAQSLSVTIFVQQ